MADGGGGHHSCKLARSTPRRVGGYDRLAWNAMPCNALQEDIHVLTTPKIFEETWLDTILGYDKRVGCRLLNIEAEKKNWDDPLAAIWNQFVSSHGLSRILRCAEVHVNLTKDSDMEDIVEFAKNLCMYVPYCLTVRYTQMLGILTLKKLVEVKFADGKKMGHRKCQCLQDLFMDLVNPNTEKPLLEAVIPVPSKPGCIQLMFLPKGKHDKLIAKMVVHPVGLWWEYMRLVLGFTDNCAKSFMNSFKIEARMGARHCILDVDTWEIHNELRTLIKH